MLIINGISYDSVILFLICSGIIGLGFYLDYRQKIKYRRKSK